MFTESTIVRPARVTLNFARRSRQGEIRNLRWYCDVGDTFKEFQKNHPQLKAYPRDPLGEFWRIAGAFLVFASPIDFLVEGQYTVAWEENGDYPESKANIFKDFLNSLQ